MIEYDAKFSNGQTWIGGRSFYPEGIPEDIVITGIRMSLEDQGKIDESWELIEFRGKSVDMTSDGAIIPKALAE